MTHPPSLFGPSAGLRPLADEDNFHASINTTPLVDVMLVLLIVFLVTIPVVSQTVPLSLPLSPAPPARPSPTNPVLSVTADGSLFWDDQPASLDLLRERLAAFATAQPGADIIIRADRQTPYHRVSLLMNICQQTGLTAVALQTDPTANSTTSR